MIYPINVNWLFEVECELVPEKVLCTVLSVHTVQQSWFKQDVLNLTINLKYPGIFIFILQKICY